MSMDSSEVDMAAGQADSRLNDLNIEHENAIQFMTLGMFIIDEIHFQPPKPPVTNILGGAGAYAALGARIMSPTPASKSVGWIVDAGSDFPQQLRAELEQWGTSCLVRETPWRKTTRGWNGYGDNEERAFKYLTPKRRLDEESLSEQLLHSNSYHLICSPLRCIDLVTKIEEKRKQIGLESKPLWIWEPVPDRCVPEELGNCRKALGLIDVVSPNHVELCAFFGATPYDGSGNANRDVIAELCSDWYSSGIGRYKRGSIVIRAGKDGCYVKSEQSSWMPAYHTSSSKVIDPTGGGNAFLGAMAITLARNRRSTKPEFDKVWEGACAGSIGASFAIEQVGVPRLETSASGEEKWNGEAAQERLDQFTRLCRRYGS